MENQSNLNPNVITWAFIVLGKAEKNQKAKAKRLLKANNFTAFLNSKDVFGYHFSDIDKAKEKSNFLNGLLHYSIIYISDSDFGKIDINF